MVKLDDINKIREIDREDMLDILLDLPGQCKDAIAIANGFKAHSGYKASGINKIFFSGVGGSAIGGDIVRTYLSRQMDEPILVNRNYDVPAFVDQKTLVFVSSYSGNTEETLSAYRQIKKKGAKMIAVTSGGELYERALGDGIPFILLPEGFPPRTAIGYMSIVPLIALSKMRFIKNKDKELREVLKVLVELRQKALSPEVPAPKNIAKQAAKEIYGRFVIIYAAEDFLGSVAARCRQELEENSKIICSASALPEMNHNEITGWEDPKRISKDFAIIILLDKDEHPRVSRRIQISKEIIAKKAGRIIEIKSRGSSLLARTFSLIYIGTFISFYLAILNGVDPTPVTNVTYLKKKLAKDR